MSKPYTVIRGDNLTKIAHRHGFRNWRAIYDHPDNAGFRRLRPNPNLIYPGDVVQIPETTTPTAHPSHTPGPPALRPIPDDKCCFLARPDNECPYTGANKSNYTCPSGYVKHHWTCTEGTREIGCGECAKSPSASCWAGPFECSIWWYIT
jgi:LysM domain